MSEQNRRARLMASGLLAITFVVGALAGAAGDRLLSAAQPADPQVAQKQPAEPKPHRSGRGRSLLLDPEVLDQLGTTEAQRARIGALLEQRDQEAKRIFSTIEPQLDSMMKRSREDVRAQLTPEQIKKLEQIIAEKSAARARARGANPSKSTPQSSQKPAHEPRDLDPFI